MKSSSQLFPVELVSAEYREHFYEDLYSLKPNKSHDKSVEIALLHLHAAKDASATRSVLFIHDAFQSHWQWMDNGANEAVIEALLKSGYSIWLMDWRAHGSSKKNREMSLNTISDMATHDLTSVVEFIEEKSHGELSIVAKGYGALMVLHALETLTRIRRFLLIDSKSVLPPRRSWLPFYRLRKRLKLIGRQTVAGNGSEWESAALFMEPLKYAGVFGLLHRARLQNQVAPIRQRAANIIWVCSKRSSEWRAKRLTKDQARIFKQAAASELSDIQQLIAS